MNAYPDFSPKNIKNSRPPKILEIDPKKNILQNRNSFILQLQDGDEIAKSQRTLKKIQKTETKDTLTFSEYSRQMIEENKKKTFKSSSNLILQSRLSVSPKKSKTPRGNRDLLTERKESIDKKESRKMKEVEKKQLYLEAQKYKKIIERKKNLNQKILRNNEILSNFQQINSLVTFTQKKNPALKLNLEKDYTEMVYRKLSNDFPNSSQKKAYGESVFSQSSVFSKPNNFSPVPNNLRSLSNDLNNIRPFQLHTPKGKNAREFDNIPAGNFVMRSTRKSELPQLPLKIIE